MQTVEWVLECSSPGDYYVTISGMLLCIAMCARASTCVCMCVCVHVPVSDSFNSKVITRSQYSTIYLIHQYLLSDYSMPHTIHVTLYDYIILALHQLYEIATV